MIAATGHEAGEWKVTQLPGRLTEGTRVLNCAKCGEVMGSEAIEPTGASHGSSSEKSTPKNLLLKRVKAIPIVIPLTSQKMRPAQKPVRKYTTVPAELLMMETIAAKGHDFSKTEIEEATCTTEGKVFKECSRCGEKEEAAVLEKLAHTPGEWKTVKEPSYTDWERESSIVQAVMSC